MIQVTVSSFEPALQHTKLNDPSLFRRLVVLLSDGHPISPERLAADLGRSCEDVVAVLHKRPSLEWDAAGNIVGGDDGVCYGQPRQALQFGRINALLATDERHQG